MWGKEDAISTRLLAGNFDASISMGILHAQARIKFRFGLNLFHARRASVAGMLDSTPSLENSSTGVAPLTALGESI